MVAAAPPLIQHIWHSVCNFTRKYSTMAYLLLCNRYSLSGLLLATAIITTAPLAGLALAPLELYLVAAGLGFLLYMATLIGSWLLARHWRLSHHHLTAVCHPFTLCYYLQQYSIDGKRAIDTDVQKDINTATLKIFKLHQTNDYTSGHKWYSSLWNSLLLVLAHPSFYLSALHAWAFTGVFVQTCLCLPQNLTLLATNPGLLLLAATLGFSLPLIVEGYIFVKNTQHPSLLQHDNNYRPYAWHLFADCLPYPLTFQVVRAWEGLDLHDYARQYQGILNPLLRPPVAAKEHVLGSTSATHPNHSVRADHIQKSMKEELSPAQEGSAENKADHQEAAEEDPQDTAKPSPTQSPASKSTPHSPSTCSEEGADLAPLESPSPSPSPSQESVLYDAEEDPETLTPASPSSPVAGASTA